MNCKKIFAYAMFIIVAAAAAATLTLSVLFDCIKPIYYTSDKSFMAPHVSVNSPVVGKTVKQCPLLCRFSNYSVAENGKYYYVYSANQFLTVSAETGLPVYFFYDRECGLPKLGEAECKNAAIGAVAEAFGDFCAYMPRAVFSAFDGKKYVFLVSMGSYGSIIVKVFADSGAVAELDAKSITVN